VAVTWRASVSSVRFNDAMRCQAIGKRLFQAYVLIGDAVPVTWQAME
jgi:hypothetical protein